MTVDEKLAQLGKLQAFRAYDRVDGHIVGDDLGIIGNRRASQVVYHAFGKDDAALLVR